MTYMNDCVRAEMLRRAAITERMAEDFISRTGLTPDECALVIFKGKQYVQWSGATQALPRMEQIAIVATEECCNVYRVHTL